MISAVTNTMIMQEQMQILYPDPPVISHKTSGDQSTSAVRFEGKRL